jgi:hypothetical protein
LVNSLASSVYAASLTSKGNWFQYATNASPVFFDNIYPIATMGRISGSLIPAESSGDNGGVYGAYVPLTPFNALAAVTPYNIPITLTGASANNALVGGPSYTPAPALLNNDTVTIILYPYTLAGSVSTNTFAYSGTVNGGTAATAYYISSCRDVLSAIATGYAVTGVITLRVTTAYGGTYWCDVSQ